MKKALFIDRDGTIIEEPPVTEQINTLDELVFRPGVLRNLYKIATELDFELVMVTNQDGLGTPGYPEENFAKVQDKMLQVLENEGIRFDAIFIDRSFAHENLPTRKPGTALLTSFLDGSYDLANCYVIGDRPTDIQLAKNLGAKAIAMQALFDLQVMAHEAALVADTWDEIYAYLRRPPRRAIIRRTTRETDVRITLDLDGSGKANIRTGIGFFDHQLEQISRHGNFDLDLETIGDLQVDEHHTVEDTAIALGEAFAQALGDKRGIERYGFDKNEAAKATENQEFLLPMDDCLAQVALDFGGRSWLVWAAEFHREKIGELPTELFSHFFKSFCDGARCNLNVKAEGFNEHHKIEAIFKAFARSLKMAVRRDERSNELPSTKGVL